MTSVVFALDKFVFWLSAFVALGLAIITALIFAYHTSIEDTTMLTSGLRLIKLGSAVISLSLFRQASAKTGIMTDYKNATTVYEFKANDIKGNEVSLETYRGKVLLIVNVASECGLTATNYKELTELDEQFRERGLRILAFPCNQFGNQEPGNSEDIVCFMKGKNANFDLFEKIEVNGDNAHPLWKFLKAKQGGTFGSGIKWNFTKFIIDKNGVPVERHSPMTNPLKLVKRIENYL